MSTSTRIGHASAVLGLSMLAAPAAVGQVGGPDVKVNSDPAGRLQNEVSLALNPARPGYVLMSFNDNPWWGWCTGLGMALSQNYGANWTYSILPIPPASVAMVDSWDPMTATDTMGNAFIGHISTNGVSGGASGLFVWRSADGGVNWPVVGQADFLASGPLIDKPHMAIDQHAASPFMNNLYVAYIRDNGLTGPYSNIWFNYTNPTAMGGATIGFPFAPQMISDLAPGVGMGNGPNVAVGSDGTVHVAWCDTNVTVPGVTTGTLYIDRSYDGGVTFGADTVAVPQIMCVRKHFRDLQFPAQNDARARSYPCITVSPLNPLDVYMVYAEDTMGGTDITNEADVYFTQSFDGGLTWTPAACIHAPWYQSGPQFEPWIRVKPNGVIDVVYYDGSPIDPGQIWWGVVFTSSADNGATWSPPLLLNDSLYLCPFEFVTGSNERWMGEYLGLDVDGTHAYVGFTSSVTDQYGDIYFDRVPNDPSLLGACCLPDGQCQTLADHDACIQLGGEWMGVGVPCVPDPCQQLEGACCLPDGNCYTVVQGECLNLGGEWLGPGFPCEPNPCPAQLAACCLPDGACVMLDLFACTDLAGIWQGPGSTCDPNHCPQPQFACCLPDGSCVDTTEVGCLDLGGSWMEPELCHPALCAPACPGDATGNGTVDVDDLILVIMQWGPCPGCPGDFDGNDVVDVDDLLEVIMKWGPCP